MTSNLYLGVFGLLSPVVGVRRDQSPTKLRQERDPQSSTYIRGFAIPGFFPVFSNLISVAHMVKSRRRENSRLPSDI